MDEKTIYPLLFLKRLPIFLILLIFLILVFLVVKERSKSPLPDSAKVEMIESLTPSIAQNQDIDIAHQSAFPSDNESKNDVQISEEQKVIEQLKCETVYDSLNNLALEGIAFETVSPQLRYTSYIIELPLGPDTRPFKNDLVRIIGNRRVAKLLEELNSLPKAEAGRLLALQIQKDLNLYRQKAEEYDILSRSNSSLKLDLDKGFLGFTLKMTRLSDEPELAYIRLSLLSQAFIAGVLELPEAAGAIMDLAEIAGEQREWFYNYENNKLHLIHGYIGLIRTGLYNPAILTTALTGTGLVDRDTAYDVVSPTRFWTEEDLTPWDASMSVYGAIDAFFAEPDFSQGRITVHYATEVSDEQFDTLLAHARGQ